MHIEFIIIIIVLLLLLLLLLLLHHSCCGTGHLSIAIADAPAVLTGDDI